jgi:DNA-binding response OmpR family regulator
MHVAIIGATVSHHSSLLDRLSSAHVVTIARTHDVLASSITLQSCDVLVLEADAQRSDILGVIAELRTRSPRTTILLVNGELAPLDVAEAFRLGIADYFAAPWNATLLVERTEALAARHRAVSTAPTDTGEDT